MEDYKNSVAITQQEYSKIMIDDIIGNGENKGMVIAKTGEECPIFGDILKAEERTIIFSRRAFLQIEKCLKEIDNAKPKQLRELDRMIALRIGGR